MVVPDYQSLMLPLLKVSGDGEEQSFHEFIENLADQLDLTDEVRREPLPSGRQAKFDNRVSWARTYMKKAGLLEYTGREKFQITEIGRSLLRQNPSEINVKYLEKFVTTQVPPKSIDWYWFQVLRII